MTDPSDAPWPDEDGATRLLPETVCLQDCLADMTWEELEVFDGQDSSCMASYRAVPEPTVPLLRFRIAEADPGLLAFVGQPVAGFEVLQAFCAGMQYHWRSDLARAFEEQIPLLGRVCGLSGRTEFAVEHLVVPLIRRHRVREIRGWFMFSQDIDACDRGWAKGDAVLFRRTEPAREVRLPARLWDPERKPVRPADFLRAVNRGWRGGRDRRHA